MASAVAAEPPPGHNRHETGDDVSPSEVREMSDSKGGDIAGWVVIGAASAVLFVGVGYTNTFGVFVRKRLANIMLAPLPIQQWVMRYFRKSRIVC